MCENNHNRPNLAFIGSSVVSWEYPDGIGNNSVEFDNWTSLHKSQFSVSGKDSQVLTTQKMLSYSIYYQLKPCLISNLAPVIN